MKTGNAQASSGGRRRVPASPRWAEIAPHAFISLVLLLFSLALLALLVYKGDKLTALGLTGNIFYVALVTLGLCAGAVLFEVLRSFALYRGEQFGGVLQLGGPIVACILVVIGGFELVPNPTPLSFTVFVHGPAGKQNLVLRNSGQVVLDLGPNRRQEAIGDKGEAYFFGVPPSFRGQSVPIGIESEAFETAQSNAEIKLGRESIYLEARRKSGILKGCIQDMNGDPVAGASIQVVDLTVSSGPDGCFTISIPGEHMEPELTLTVTASGYLLQRHTVVPNANPITITLRRK